MKIPYGWVREFVDLELDRRAGGRSPDQRGRRGRQRHAASRPSCAGVVVGEIEAIERELGESHGHRLVLCRVSTGRERFAVVCGAPNAAVGVRAAFAPPGASCRAAREITVAKIRGVESQGMLCSERELGLGEEHEAGMLLLDAAARSAPISSRTSGWTITCSRSRSRRTARTACRSSAWPASWRR